MTQAKTIMSDRGRIPDAFRAALRDQASLILTGMDKGIPNGSVPFGQVGDKGWNILAGDLPMPNLVLKQAAVEHNIALMQAYCDRHKAWLAPHGKTMMAPQLWAQQLEAGAWAITVANIAQLHVCRAFGIPRVLVANEVVTPYDARYLGQQLREDADAEIYVYVDSEAGLQTLCAGLQRSNAPRPLPVFVELGMPGGRCGVRSIPNLVSLARAVMAASPLVELVGVAGYEGIAAGASYEDRLDAADRYLEQLAEGVRAVKQLGPTRNPFLVTAGGSVYFDRVVERLGHNVLDGTQLVLRSGGYVTHDSSFYEKSSPFGSKSPRPQPGERLIPALEVWSAVMSLPEPGLAILGMGGRDMPTDIEYPTPLYHSRGKGHLSPLDERYTVVRANDQHAYLQIPDDADFHIGDLVGCGISHPCTAFDKWRTILVVNEGRSVTEALRTYF